MNRVSLTLPVEATTFSQILLTWYRVQKRDLPWRESLDPYRIWLSEIMLQQTRVQTVVPYFERFVGAYPTLEHLAHADEEEVLDLWSGLGYYGRARNLHKTAKLIKEEHGGEFPEEYAEVVRLPGIGPYSAAAILSIAFGQTHAVLDGNVRRVLARYLAIREEVKGPVERSLKSCLAEIAGSVHAIGRIGDFNQALMELGALVCTPKDPRCVECPLKESCRAFSEALQGELPKQRKKPATQEIHLTVAVVERASRYLMCRNTAGTYLRGLWEFPKLNGWPAKEVLTALFSKTHGLEILPLEICEPVIHHVTFRKLMFRPVKAALAVEPQDGPFRWVRFGEKPYPVSSYIPKIITLAGRTPSAGH